MWGGIAGNMRILLAIVHYWRPEENASHQSLRANPQLRVEALQAQLLGLRRVMGRQGVLNIAERCVQPTNADLRHSIDIRLITDGEHHVIERLAPPYQGLADVVITEPSSPRHLGFQAQRYLASQLGSGYDLYGYLEDDLVIHDPMFFSKVHWIQHQLQQQAVVLPHRYELCHQPDPVDKLYIDGPMPTADLRMLLPDPAPPVQSQQPGGVIRLESPANPHAGCFFLTAEQLHHWTQQPCWQDGDCSFVSPLESAATLGIARCFQLYKPALSCASWLELQHWGSGFRCLIGAELSLDRALGLSADA